MSEKRATDAYLAMLAGVGERADEIGDRPIASHWPFIGTDYARTRLLVVGQALAGWDDKSSPALWAADRATTPAGRDELLLATQGWATHRAEPMDEPLAWRAGASFWDLNKKAVTALEPDGPGPWQSRFAWWNLFPFAWGDTNRSPWFDPLWDAQFPRLGELFWSVVEWLQPRRVVILAGSGFWGPTAGAVSLHDLPKLPWPLIAGGERDGRAIVWTRHPGGHYRGLTRQAFAEAIANAVTEIEAASSADARRGR